MIERSPVSTFEGQKVYDLSDLQPIPAGNGQFGLDIEDLSTALRQVPRFGIVTLPSLEQADEEPSNFVLLGGKLAISGAAHTVQVQGENVHLAPKEFSLLTLFARNVGIMLPHNRITREVWGVEYLQNHSNTTRVHMGTMRRKLGPEVGPHFITVRGMGYKLIEELPD